MTWQEEFEQRLLRLGLIDDTALARGKGLARRDGISLDRALLRLGLVEEAEMISPLAEAMGLPLFDPVTASADAMAAERLTLPFLGDRLAVPLLSDGEGFGMAMADPANAELRRELEFLLDARISPVVSSTTAVRALLAKLADGSAALRPAPGQEANDDPQLAEADGPVIRYVAEVLADAVGQGASDIHLESTADGFSLRFRINGVLAPQRVDGTLEPSAVIARFKVMAGVNVAERRLPQDGRMEAMIAGRKIDFRFSSLPTQHGESIVARVLDPRQMRRGLDSLGFPPEVIARLRDILKQPSGLLLATGPTGSGKTTTLYAAISHLNSPGRKIVTVEDPVEYNLPGVQQVQVHEEIGLTFARVLRGVLRHDPNVILIGEIRDQETAEIAVRAAQVGRLVLSTLHTNSAAGAINRLVDLGVPEFLVRDVLRGVLGQELRLVPCVSCKGRGCDNCGRTGVGLRELHAELVEYPA